MNPKFLGQNRELRCVIRSEFTDPAPAKENADPRGVQWKTRAARCCWEQPQGRGSGWECCQPGLGHSALHLGEQCLRDFCFDLGFYLTDYSLPPYLPLFNCFFFLLPSLLTLFFFLPLHPPCPVSPLTICTDPLSSLPTSPRLLPRVPPPPCCSLLSRTLATRTVMSSMQSWTRPLWPRHPALGPPSMLAET